MFALFFRSLSVVTLLALPAISHAEQNPQDRAQQHGQAKKDADKGNQMLQIPIAQHMGEAKKHQDEAKKARQQQNHGKAEEEERKAKEEMMKVQQLQQQQQANKKSGDDNQDHQNYLTQDNEPKGQNTDAKQPQSGQNKVIDLRISDGRQKAVEDTTTAATPVNDTSVPDHELADLSSVKPADRAPSSTANSTPWTPGPDIAGKNPEQDSQSISFQDSAMKPSSPSSTTSSSQSSSGSGSLAGGGAGGGSPMVSPAQGSSGGSLGGADFWGSVGAMVDEGNAQEEAKGKLSLSNLRGMRSADEAPAVSKGQSLPGKELNDEAFWKKVGKEPVQCKVTGTSPSAKRQKQACLKTARRDFEKRWRDSQQREVASKK